MNIVEYSQIAGPEYILLDKNEMPKINLISSVSVSFGDTVVQKMFTNIEDLLVDLIENRPNDIEFELLRLSLYKGKDKNVIENVIPFLRKKYENRSEIINVIDKYF